MSGQWEDGDLSTVGARLAPAAARERMTEVIRRRARDEQDALLLLDAFGLLDKPAPAQRKPPLAAPVVHGEQSGVDYHAQAGTRVCAACRGFLRTLDPAAACGEDCASPQAYWRHLNRNEPTCQASRDAHTAYKAARRAAGVEKP